MVAHNCYVLSLRHHVLKKGKETLSIQTEEDPREEKSRPKSVEGLKEGRSGWNEKECEIGASLTEEHTEALTLLLIEFKELFT